MGTLNIQVTSPSPYSQGVAEAGFESWSARAQSVLSPLGDIAPKVQVVFRHPQPPLSSNSLGGGDG